MLPDDNEKIKECLKILKQMVYDSNGKEGKGGGGGALETELKDVKNKLRMKENEINILMNLIKKKGINPNEDKNFID